MEITLGKASLAVKDGGEIESSPAVSDGVVYIGSEDSYLYALDAKTGGERWKFKALGRIHYSSPCVWENSVYFGDNSGRFYSVDTKTGEEKW